MKHNIILAIVLFLSIGLHAQDYSGEKMSKDLEIAEDVLVKLTQQQMATDAWRDDVEGKYLEDYGVVFTIRTMVESYSLGIGKDQIFVRSGGRYAIKGGIAFMEKDDVEEEQLDRMEIIRNTALNFLTNYAFLIRQLQPNDKILLNFVDGWEEAAVINPFPNRRTSQRRTATLTAEVQRKDIDALRSRKISEEEFEERIRFTEDAEEEANDPDVELLISIFNRLYEEDLTETFVIHDDGRYTDIKGLGTIIDLNVDYPSNDEDLFIINRNGSQNSYYYRYGKHKKSREEGQDEDCDCPDGEEMKKLKNDFSKLYDQFIEEFKGNLVEYGQTIQSLEDDEMLVFRLHFDSFDMDYEMTTDVSIQQSALRKYSAGELSLEKAIEQVKVVENKEKDGWR